MDWSLVNDFIQQRNPAFLTQVNGVPGSTISALAASHSITLPAVYVALLQQMGVNSNGYKPFGATCDHYFATITERLHEADEDAPPVNRFFPVAIETDTSFDPIFDYYLDLQCSNGEDAPLILLEPGVPFQWQTPIETSETVGERIINSVFNHFQLSHCTQRDVVTMGGTHQTGEGQMALQQALPLLQQLGFEPVLPSQERVVCLQAGSLSVLAKVNESYGLLTLLLGSNEVQALKTLAGQLLAGLPDARRPAGAKNWW